MLSPSQREQAVAVNTWRDMRSKFSNKMEDKILDGTYDDDTFNNIDRLESTRRGAADVEEDRDERVKERQFDRDQRAYKMQQQDAAAQSDADRNIGIRERDAARGFQASEAGRDRLQQRQGWDAQKEAAREGRAENENRDQLNFAARMNESSGPGARSTSSAAAEAAKDRAQRTLELSMQMDDNKYHTFMRSAKGDAGRYW